MEIEVEVWKDIDDYPNYQVSSFGRVKSKPRQRTKGGILKTEINRVGYEKVCISNENGVKTVSVHRLVAKAFLKEYNNKLQVNHKDGNKQNNNINNLEMVTHSENIRHRFEILKQEPFRKYKEKIDWNTKEGVNKYARNYYQKNKEKILEYGRQWRKKKRDKIKSILTKEQIEKYSYKVGGDDLSNCG